ncbi:MAG: imidazole glycerol phosphate synthase subunit HisH [Actinobacteria bacterium]|nr:imidazole glycerol phosphate synthase subunit HisH [Actinomycetota bacterium]
MIVVVDYGAGNIHSVARALTRVGAQFEVTNDPASVTHAQAIVLPGVGAARDTMRGLQTNRVDDPVVRAIARGVPYFGVCMGMQVLFERSDEDGDTACLGVLPGRAVRFPAGLHVPHIGWNQVHQVQRSPLFAGLPQDANAYFVHAYFAQPADPAVVAATTEYGAAFPSAVLRDNLFAVQFHPEKSGLAGLRIYANFVRLVGQTPRPEFA